MATNISYNSYNLQDSEIITSIIEMDDFKKTINTLEPGRKDGVLYVSNEYQPKTVHVEGYLCTSTISGLNSKIDEFKTKLADSEKALDVDFMGITKRFNATPQNLMIERESYHVDTAPFAVDFLVPQGIGYDTTLYTGTVSGFTSDISNGVSMSILGTAAAEPLITFQFTNGGKINTLELTHNDQKLTTTVSGTAFFAPGDTVSIDCNKRAVYLGGNISTYSGMFPAFPPGTDNFYVNFYGGTNLLDQSQIIGNADDMLSGRHWIGQSFTTGVAATGTLPRVDLLYRKVGDVGSDLMVDIYSSSGGLVSTLLTTQRVVESTIQDVNGWYPVFFDSPASISAGTMYFIVLHTEYNVGNNYNGYLFGRWFYGCDPNSTNAYANGNEWTSYNAGATWTNTEPSGLDLMFKTYYKSGLSGHSGQLTVYYNPYYR